MNTCLIKQKSRAEKSATKVINGIFLNSDSKLSTIDFLNKIKETFNSSEVLLQYFNSENLKYLLSGEIPGSEIEPGKFPKEQIDQYFKEKETTVTEFNKSPITLNENWNKKSVEDLFKGSVANYNYLLQNFRYEFFHTAILKIDEENEENSKFINNNTNLNNELKNYLIKKFKQIQDYLKHQGYKISNQKLFTDTGNVSKTYLETIGIAIDLINNGNYFKLNYNTHPTDVNFLNNVIILTKLDELIGTNFNQLIGINGNYYKFITGNKGKYFFNDTSQALGIYAEDDEMRHSVTNTQSELFSLICSVIPMRDGNGKIIPNQFLNSNFVQQSAIKLKTELYNLFCNRNTYLSLNSNFQDIITDLSTYLPKLKNDKFLVSLSKYFENLNKIISKAKEKNLYFLDIFDLFGFEMEKVNVPVLNFFKNGEKNSYHIKTKETNEFFIDNLINQIKTSINNGTPFEIFNNIDNLTLDFLQGISGEKFVQELQSLGINISLLKTKIINNPDELESFKDFLRILKDTKLVEQAENLKVKASVLKIADQFSYYTDDTIGLQTWNSENKAIPTVRLSSSIFQDSYYIHRYRQTHGKLKETNILTEYPKFFSNELNVNYSYSTGIKIDAIKGKKAYKSAQSFTPTESLISEIKFGYFESLKNGIFEFQPVAYSDKATIFTKLINLHTEIKHNGKNISFLDLINKGPEELSKFYFKFQSNYYNSIKSDLLNLWNNIFQKEKGFKKFLTLDELNDFLYMQDFDQLQEKLINYLKDNPNIELVEERDYSIYEVSGQKKFALNKSLLKAITVNTNEDLFNETLDKRFKSFYSYLESNDILQYVYQTERLDSEQNSEINKTKLKTYLLLKNMFTEAYLSLTAGHPWIHASKKGMIYMTEEQFKDLKANELNLEESGRYAAHGKRNNIFTGSKEGYTLDSEKGIIRQVKCAIIDDTENEVYNLSGHIVKSKQLDGSLFAMKWTQDLLANSLPGRKQKGTQKNFTHHVGKNYSMQIKDAQFEIDNNWVRKSKDIDGQTTSFKNFIQNKLCLQIPTDKDIFKGINLYFLLNKFPTLFKNGEYQKIKNITKDVSGKYLVTFDILNSSGDTINKNQIKLVDINTIYDIWDLFGAEYSGSFTNNKFQFDETSMDIITQLMIKVKDDEGSKYLQESVIHIFGPKSAFKSGAVNVTPKEYFRNKEKLTYFTLDLGSSGLQNDKNHIVDEDSIKEMSQVISALAANGYTKDLADEAYTEIASIIESVVNQLQKSIKDKSGDTKQKQKFYKDFSKKLIKAFKSANKLSLGQVILEVSKNSGIPFSDPNLYHKFISSILVGLNSDTIKRKYTGLAGILTPSDGIVKILEDENHKKYLLTDIYNESIKDENISEFKLANPDVTPTNDELFNFYLNKKFPKEREVDSFELNIGDWVKINGKDYNINNPIQLKIIQDSNTKITKIFNKGRDLRPSIHTWNIVDDFGIQKKRNIWSSPIVIISYFLNGYNGSKDELLNNFPDLIFKYQKLAAQYKSLYGENSVKQIQKQIQEYTIMLDSGQDLKSEFDFLRFLKISSEPIPQNYETVEITNYEVQEAECILPAVYAKKFNIENKTLREVMDNAEEIFKNQIEPIYKESLKETDLTVNVGSIQYGIRFMDFNLQKISENLQDITETYESEFIDGEEFFVDFEHNPLFKKDDNLRIVLDPQTETTYIYVNGSKVSDQTYLMQFLESFNSDFIRYTSEFSTVKSSRILEVVKKLNKDFSDIYKKFSSLQLKELDKALTKESTKFINKLVQEKISTFELTQHIISSRIPAQSMQSFMAMENVGFTGSDLNNIYVSRWQIWIQGSDFDIDVAYNLMYSINKHGKLYDYSPYFDYTSYKTLQESLKLPKPNPNKNITEIGEENIWFTNLYNVLNEERNTESDKIKYLKNLKILLSLNEIKGTKEQLKFFKELIDKHNKYSVNTESSKNLILSKIREISNNIKNMQSSYMSVDLTTGKFKKEAKDITNKEDQNGNFPDIYNGYSNFELQQANYVGKKTVGIFANALKGFFVLTQYFNTHPEAKVNKSVIVNGKHYDLKMANRNINGITEELIQELEYASNCDLDLSAFLSLATDNAKELILGVLNAGQEFAGTYAYLLVCGVDLHDIVALLTSDEVKKLVKEVQGNIFDLSDKKQKTLSKLIQKSGNDQLEKIYNGAQEFRALTSILSINQGVKNTPHELISFKNSFQSIFNSQLHKKFKDKNYEDIEEFEVRVLLDELDKEGVIIKSSKTIIKDGVEKDVHEIYFKILDFNKFFKDENYRKLIIKMYDVVKDTFNIYEILSESKSFYNMLDATSLTDESLQKIALKYATVSQAQARVQELFKKLPSGAFAGQFVRIISEQQIKDLQNMIDHKLIYSWLNTDKIKKDFTFNVKDFYQYSGSIYSKKNEIIDLSTNKGILKFKELVENILIEQVLKRSPYFYNNEFVRNLIQHVDKYDRGSWYKLKHKLTQSSDIRSQVVINSVYEGFEELKNIPIPIPNTSGKFLTFGSILYVYNLIATKNKLGEDKLSMIFESEIQDNPLIQDFLNFEAKQDLENDANFLTDEEFLFALYETSGIVKIPKKANTLGEYINNVSENENYTDLDGPDSTSQLEIDEDVPNSKDNEDSSSKTDENYNIYKVDRAKGNEFKNLIELKDSIPSYLKSDLLNKLLNYIQSNSTIVKLECK